MLLRQGGQRHSNTRQRIKIDVFLCDRWSKSLKFSSGRSKKKLNVSRRCSLFIGQKADYVVGEASFDREDRCFRNIGRYGNAKGALWPKLALTEAILIVVSGGRGNERISRFDIARLDERVTAPK